MANSVEPENWIERHWPLPLRRFQPRGRDCDAKLTVNNGLLTPHPNASVVNPFRAVDVAVFAHLVIDDLTAVVTQKTPGLWPVNGVASYDVIRAFAAVSDFFRGQLRLVVEREAGRVAQVVGNVCLFRQVGQ